MSRSYLTFYKNVNICPYFTDKDKKTEEPIGNILRVIGTANVSEEQRGSATADVLQLAAETFGRRRKSPATAEQAKDRHPIHKTGDEKDANEIP